MRALLILLALLLALPAAALELLPTTLQLPAQGGSAELWLTTRPGRWQGQVQVLAWDQQLDAERLHPSDQIRVSPAQLDLAPAAPSASGCCQAIRQRRPLNRPIGSCWRRRCRGCRAIRCRCSAASGASTAGPAAGPSTHGSLAVLRLSNAGTLHGRLHDLRFITAERTLLTAGLAGYLLAGHERRWPCLPAPMAMPAAASRPACRTAARSIWPQQTLQLQQAPSGL
jgi:fimbrial chaperone protein